MQKAYLLFGEAAAGLQSLLATESGAASAFALPSPKIAKGENYNGLPYVMLDYPRLFSKEDIFAFRTMFWWGNFLSFTWHLKGRYALQFRRNILGSHDKLAQSGFHLCITEDEWRHDFDESNYLSLREVSPRKFADLLNSNRFIKLAVRIPLDQWNHASGELIRYYRVILELIKISYPGDGRDPLPGNPITGFDL